MAYVVASAPRDTTHLHITDTKRKLSSYVVPAGTRCYFGMLFAGKNTTSGCESERSSGKDKSGILRFHFGENLATFSRRLALTEEKMCCGVLCQIVGSR